MSTGLLVTDGANYCIFDPDGITVDEVLELISGSPDRLHEALTHGRVAIWKTGGDGGVSVHLTEKRLTKKQLARSAGSARFTNQADCAKRVEARART